MSLGLGWKISAALGLDERKRRKRRPREDDEREERRDDKPWKEIHKDEPPSIAALIDDVLERRCVKPVFFRPSMLFGCDRANVFHYNQMAPFHPKRVNPRMLRILDNGTAVHEVLQGYLADHPEWFFAKESRVYRKVGGAWIRGSCDGVLIRREDGYRVGIEIKTIAHLEFLKLTKPKPEHIQQASVYAKLQDLHWIVVVYWDKDKQNLKDYPVEYDRESWLKTKKRIKSLKQFVDDDELPVFDLKQCQRNKDFCPYADHCRHKGGSPHLVPARRW